MINFTKSYSPYNNISYPVEAQTTINPAVFVALNASKNLVEATDTAGLTVVGVSLQLADNSDLQSVAGDVLGRIAPFGVVSCAYDGLTKTDILTDVYIKNNSTIQAESASTNSIKAGLLIDIDDNFATILIQI